MALEPIPGLENDRRFICERWIGENPLVKACNLGSTRTDHYSNRPYPRSRYARLPELDLESPRTAPEWRDLENRWQDLLEVVDPLEQIIVPNPGSDEVLLPLALAIPRAQIIAIGSLEIGDENLPANIRQIDFNDPVLADMQADVVCLPPTSSLHELKLQFDTWEPRLRPGGCILYFGGLRQDEVGIPEFLSSLAGRSALVPHGCGLSAWYKPAAYPDSALTIGRSLACG